MGEMVIQALKASSKLVCILYKTENFPKDQSTIRSLYPSDSQLLAEYTFKSSI